MLKFVNQLITTLSKEKRGCSVIVDVLGFLWLAIRNYGIGLVVVVRTRVCENGKASL